LSRELGFAFDIIVAAFISASDQETSPEPFTDFPVLPMVSVLPVPQLAVVMSALPLKLVPLMFRAVCNVVAVAALPVVFWFSVGIRAAANVPAVIQEASKAGIRACAKVPEVIFPASNEGTCEALSKGTCEAFN
jgi:hypothetical protein